MNNTEYIFCSVIFGEKGKPYYYLTIDDSIEVGDYVEVLGMHFPSVAKVVKIEKFSKNNAPYDVEKVKSITKLLKKHNAPLSTEQSLYTVISTEHNPDEDLETDGLFDCLDEIICEVQPTLTEEQIAYFEKNNNITLPVQYREMLLKEGNGLKIHYKTPEEGVFHGDTHYRVIRGINWKRKSRNKRLSRPFMFGEKTSIDINDLPYPQFKDCLEHILSEADDICNICDHKYECVFSYAGEYTSTPFYNGTLKLLDAGCTYSYHLILNGPRRGEIWFSNENEQFLRYAKSFKEFIEKMCTAEYV